MEEEIKTVKDKMQKLAIQFDKELSERDRTIKVVQTMSQGELQRGLQQLEGELAGLKQKVAEFEPRKLEKKEFIDFKAKINGALELKAANNEV